MDWMRCNGRILTISKTERKPNLSWAYAAINYNTIVYMRTHVF